jgi:hypothetical protein
MHIHIHTYIIIFFHILYICIYTYSFNTYLYTHIFDKRSTKAHVTQNVLNLPEAIQWIFLQSGVEPGEHKTEVRHKQGRGKDFLHGTHIMLMRSKTEATWNPHPTCKLCKHEDTDKHVDYGTWFVSASLTEPSKKPDLVSSYASTRTGCEQEVNRYSWHQIFPDIPQTPCVLPASSGLSSGFLRCFGLSQWRSALQQCSSSEVPSTRCVRPTSDSLWFNDNV